jgi:PHD/YefM family antitoxin component YafN of YafNO toxin-antitoxin module
MSTQVIPITKGRDRLLQLAREAQRHFARTVLTCDGVPQAVILGYDEFEGWLETVEICQSRRVVREIKRAERLADRRKTRTLDEVFGKVRR